MLQESFFDGINLPLFFLATSEWYPFQLTLEMLLISIPCLPPRTGTRPGVRVFMPAVAGLCKFQRAFDLPRDPVRMQIGIQCGQESTS